MQVALGFAHVVDLKGLRIIFGVNFGKQKLYMRNCGMVLTSTITIMVATQVHLFKLISLLDNGTLQLINSFIDILNYPGLINLDIFIVFHMFLFLNIYPFLVQI